MKICIDAGHGMDNRNPGVFDPGAISGVHRECDIALTWALSGKFLLREAGIEVFLTREHNGDVAPVGERDDRAKLKGCTHFISIHCNSDKRPMVRGTETFYGDAGDMDFAQDVQSAAILAMGLPDRGIKRDSESQHKSLAVLEFGPPACLLETGFISNHLDREKLNSKASRVKFWTEFIRKIRGGT